MKRLGALIYLLLCMMLMMTTTAHAYIDPSVTTYAIQAIAGGAIAIGAFVTIYWRRAKKKMSKVLKIDENAKKQMEDEIVEYHPDDVNRESK